MLHYAYVEFIDSIAGRFAIGLLIAGMISFPIRDNYFAESTFAAGLPGMLLMIAIGTPLYVCSTSSRPIAVALVAKGFSPGAAFVFLIAGPATNAATIAILWKVLGKKSLAVYLVTIMAGAIGMGYLLNLFLLRWQGLTPALFAQNLQYVQGEALSRGWLGYILPAIPLVLLLISLLKRLPSLWARNDGQVTAQKTNREEPEMAKLNVKIAGMSCEHCVANVKRSIARLEGVSTVSVNLKKQSAIVRGDVALEDVKDAIEAAGYQVKSQ